MKSIAKFYTLFWIIYYPVCIAFQSLVNYDWSDEILTVALLLFAFNKQKYLVRDHKRKKEIVYYIIIMAFYTLYSFIINVTTTKGIILDLLQQLRPYAIFYITWLMAPQFTNNQKRLIKLVMLYTFAVVIVAYFVNPALIDPFLASRSGEDISGESAPLGQIALGCAMTYYLFSKQSRKNRIIAILIMLVGLLSGKSKYIGECIAFIALVSFVNEKIKFNSIKTVGQVAVLSAVVIFFTWTKFNAYYVDGFINRAEEMARPASYTTAARMIMHDYVPFGSGLGSFGTAAAAKEYSPIYYKYGLDKLWGLSPENPMFLADAFYPSLAEFGIVGLFFFIIFWRRRIKETNRVVDVVHYRMAFMCILALALESTADTSYLSGKGMGYFMILAICLNSSLYNNELVEQPINEIQDDQNVQDMQNPT